MESASTYTQFKKFHLRTPNYMANFEVLTRHKERFSEHFSIYTTNILPALLF